MKPDSPERKIPEESTHLPSSRQRMRLSLIILSFILYPVTFAYLSCPIITEAASQGILTAGLIIFALAFIASLLLGRLWCAYLCPVGGLQEACNLVLGRPLLTRKLDWLKYLVFLGIFGGIALAIWSAGGFTAIDLFYGTRNGISILAENGIVMFLAPVIMTLFFVLIFGKRGFCHTFCPIAVMLMMCLKIRNLAGYPALQLEAKKDKCSDCKRCMKECPMSLDVNGMVRNGKMENAECILCAGCADICPEGAISYTWNGTIKEIS